MTATIPDRADRLDAALGAAHADGGAARLAQLYARAADLRDGEGAQEAACFYLTQAYVWALDAGDPMAAGLHARLRALGREQ